MDSSAFAKFKAAQEKANETKKKYNFLLFENNNLYFDKIVAVHEKYDPLIFKNENSSCIVSGDGTGSMGVQRKDHDSLKEFKRHDLAILELDRKYKEDILLEKQKHDLKLTELQ